jgi:hypothetical protein
MAVVVTAAVAGIAIITITVATIVAVMTITTVMSISAMVAIMGHVHVLIPIVANEVDRVSAGLVAVAVLTPVFFMTRLNAKVDRMPRHGHRLWNDDHRPRIDDLRLWSLTDIDVSIEPGLADGD